MVAQAAAELANNAKLRRNATALMTLLERALKDARGIRAKLELVR